jgi:YVTN family beta-propeller protein
MYVSNIYDQTVSVIDTKNNNTLLPEILVGEYPNGVTVNPSNGYLYVVNEPGTYTEISVIDIRNNNTRLFDIPLRQWDPQSIVINPSNGYLYLSNGDVDNNTDGKLLTKMIQYQ